MLLLDKRNIAAQIYFEVVSGRTSSVMITKSALHILQLVLVLLFVATHEPVLLHVLLTLITLTFQNWISCQVTE